MSAAGDEAKLQGTARHLDSQGLIAIGWVGVGLAAVFVALRCYARFTEMKRLHADDYWMLAALMFLTTNAILSTLQSPSLYYLVDVSVGRVPAGAPLLVQGNIYVRYEFVIIGLFWTVLWCVKASFLSLFYRLFDGLPNYRRLWWAVVLFSGTSYIGCWIASVYTCHPPSTYFQFGACMKPIDVRGGNISISYSTAVDILSDIMIMLLPLRLLHKLQVSRRQKLGLAGVFCVGIMVVASAIARLTQIIGQERSDPVGLSVWGLVESSISVMVGSLPPLKNMLGKKLSRTRRGYSPYAGEDGTFGSQGRGKVSSALKSRTKTVSIQMKGSDESPLSSHSHSDSKGRIHVQQEFGWARTTSEPDAESGSNGHDAYDDEARIIGLGK